MSHEERLAAAVRNLLIAQQATDEARRNYEDASAHGRNVWNGANTVLAAYEASKQSGEPE